ncbi:6-phosphofructokinase [Olavius algarvensis spirochete endosymbiont]|nr:6-phosphofructokinase [Olavius algarvensis spirochete endosymbiont]
MIPEIPFAIEGENGLLRNLERRLDKRGHAVILVAEGAGQNLLNSKEKTYGKIGPFLQKVIKEYLLSRNREANIKYIDPSYIIRATPAGPADSHYCARLGANAVHAAMTGRTACIIGQWSNFLVHVPIRMATYQRKQVNSSGSLWRDVLESTRQPMLLTN